MLQISQNIKQSRLDKKMSQQEVADKLGEKRSTYAEWERDTEPKAGVIPKLSEIFGVSIRYLLGLDENPSDEIPPTNKKADKTEVLLEVMTGLMRTQNNLLQEQKDQIVDKVEETRKKVSTIESNLTRMEKNQQRGLSMIKSGIVHLEDVASVVLKKPLAEIKGKTSKVASATAGLIAGKGNKAADNQGKA